MNPWDMIDALRNRRGMILLDGRYITMAAFLTGYDAAHNRQLLCGFNEWVAERILHTCSGFHWSAIIAEKHVPGALDRGLFDGTLGPEYDDLLCSATLSMLEEFTGEEMRSSAQ